MKVNYYSIGLRPQVGSSLFSNISTSLHSLIQAGNQSVSLNGAFYTIHHMSGDVFVFLKTNDTDIIKKVDKVQNSYQDISTILQQNEEIAFASYVIANPRCIGFGSTLFGPKIGAFSTYYDKMFFNLNNNNNIVLSPITTTITPAKALSFAHMGKVNFTIDSTAPFSMNEIGNWLGIGNADLLDVDSFEITIKPKNRKNIRNVMVPTLTNLPTGIRDMTIAAKQLIGDQAVELQVIAAGGIYDKINIRGAASIDSQMIFSYNNNADLRLAGF